jgi:hypothetical protein
MMWQARVLEVNSGSSSFFQMLSLAPTRAVGNHLSEPP